MKMTITKALKEGYELCGYSDKEYQSLMRVEDLSKADISPEMVLASKEFTTPTVAPETIAEMLAEHIEEMHSQDTGDDTEQIYHAVSEMDFSETANKINEELKQYEFRTLTDIQLVPDTFNRIIFVGLHNKPNRMPLDILTKTGKLVNRIVNALPKGVVVKKTNLFDVDDISEITNYKAMANDWIFEHNPNDNDIIVLLGAMTHKHFSFDGGHVIKVAHPASRRSHKEMNDYIIDVYTKIKAAYEMPLHTI